MTVGNTCGTRIESTFGVTEQRLIFNKTLDWDFIIYLLLLKKPWSLLKFLLKLDPPL
jgi:hypothetical protein